jgi:hypothetical protein
MERESSKIDIYPESNPQTVLQLPVYVGMPFYNKMLSGTALDYGLDDRGFDFRQGLGIFLFTTASRPALGPTQPPIQWVPGAVSLGIKRPGCEADHTPPSSAEVKNAWSYTSTLPVRLHGVVIS